ncbi:MAG: efflux RND transporter periplasmic adaptor subunit [Desulfomonilia bacterium]|jgi:HlyD family secretion protein|nr:efflux RND transporter periplasmic adaptor subunit [Deltaproteobacteria bacterium]HRS56678.1 efflux RND transporter periplasmic adaptor subunit [Desulfomonilia bacterium]HRV35459.1 efflux RND transporter periplasmic adaptor subunit [Desulfomonilia bacterium]
MKRQVMIPILILAVLIAGGILYALFTGRNDRDVIRVSGNIEATEVQLSFKIPGRLQSRPVSEGDRVKKGQIVAELDRSDEEVSVEQARSNVNYARSVLRELEKGSRTQEVEAARAELKRAQAGLETAQAQLELARSDYERFSKLQDQGGISLRDLEEYRTRYAVAQSAYGEADARVRAARQQLSLVEEGPRKEKIEQAASQLESAEKALKKAELFLSYTTLRSPMDAVVLSTAAEAGEYLNPGTPVMTIADLERPWLRAYVSETDLGRIALNQEVEVTTDTYPGKVYQGRISFISSEAEFTPKSVQTEEERVNLVYRIKISLKNPNQELKPGMPADAVIRLSE